MSFRKVSQSYDNSFTDSSLFPKQFRDYPVFKEKLARPKLKSRFQHYLNSSPIANNSRIKEILGISDSKYSVLTNSKHLKLSTNYLPIKKIKFSSWLLPYKKYSILPKPKPKSLEKLNPTHRILESAHSNEPSTDRESFTEYKSPPTDRKIVLSKLSNKSYNLLNSSLESEYY